jgi:hypothetical protein
MSTTYDWWAERTAVDGDCIVWVRAKGKDGTGKTWWEGRYWSAHRLAYEHFVGPIPPGLEVIHLCRRPDCVTPEHLVATNASTRMRHGSHPSGVKSNRLYCNRGHSLLENGYWWRGHRRCRVCAVAYNRAYEPTDEQRARMRAAKKAWYDANRERVRAKQADYRRRNRERIREYSRSYEHRHRERLNAQARARYARRKARERKRLNNNGRRSR